jgi:hypothetical protein
MDRRAADVDPHAFSARPTKGAKTWHRYEAGGIDRRSPILAHRIPEHTISASVLISIVLSEGVLSVRRSQSGVLWVGLRNQRALTSSRASDGNDLRIAIVQGVSLEDVEMRAKL